MLYCNRKKFNVTGLNWLFMNAIPLQDLELKVNFTYKDCAIRSSLKMPNSVGEVDALFEAMSE